MKAPWSGQLSVTKAGWLIALLFFGWLAFLFVPAPKPEAPPVLSPSVKPPPSRLVALGLPDNPDLEQLPEYFGLYADQAEWKNDKTKFAYWNPGSRTYTYFLEATRAGGAYRFKVIPEPGVAGKSDVIDGSQHWGENLPEGCPIQFLYSDRRGADNARSKNAVLHVIPAPVVKLNISADPIKPPAPDLDLRPLDLEPKKK